MSRSEQLPLGLEADEAGAPPGGAAAPEPVVAEPIEPDRGAVDLVAAEPTDGEAIDLEPIDGDPVDAAPQLALPESWRPAPPAPLPEPGPRRPFHVREPIGWGVTVLEASAGTGKTHTVASLVAAEVAEGRRRIDQILVVTFTTKATGTLRERVWERLVTTARALDAGPLPPQAADDPTLDELEVHLRRGTAADVALRRARLEEAASTFDTATIATTHGFCQQVLAGLGVVGDSEPGGELVEDVDDIVADAVDDLFVRRFHDGATAKLFGLADARAIADVVIANPDAEIAGVDGADLDILRQRFARTLRRRIDDQKRRARLLTYDDLLTRLRDSVTNPELGALVVERLRRRFTMAVVDEFQDTDTIQWDILRHAFDAEGTSLVLVGDPKQAIYAFRGGDVHTYLAATAGAETRTLDVSWRADQALLDVVDGIFAGARLGDDHIVHRPLRARPGAERRRITGPGVDAAVSVRIVDRETSGVTLTGARYLQKDAARAFIAADLAGEAVRLLTTGVELLERDRHGDVVEQRPIRPGDLAVLVRRHKDAETVRDALLAVGVPAVAHANDDVMTAGAAAAWLELLEALEQPARTTLTRAAALGPFLGWDATRLVEATDADWDLLDDKIHDWAATVRAHGASGLLARLDATDDLSARLLGRAGGERLLADLRHLAELLDQRQPGHPTSIAALVGWLRDERTRRRSERRRRLESDADAVAIHTIHGAKGLEFPVVLLPTLWDPPWTPDDELPVFHDPDRGGARSIGVGSGGPVLREQQDRARAERDAEDLRLLYVALTRARHRLVLWWGTSGDSRSSALARILLGREPGSPDVRDRLGRNPSEEQLREAFAALAPEAVRWLEVLDAAGPGGDATGYPAPPVVDTPLVARTFDRGFDTCWTRTSYSGLTAAAHELATAEARHDEEAAVAAETGTTRDPAAVDTTVDHEDEIKVDEPELRAERGLDDLDADDPRRALVPLGTLPAGPRLGTMVHDLLEHTDFAAPDLVDALRAAAADAGAERHVEGEVEALVAGLAAAIETPLGSIADGHALRAIGRADRLDELSFDLPLAGGDDPTGAVLTMATVAEVFATLPADDPLAGYHERLRDPLLTASVRGFLTGSIDLVARLGDRHLVVDYKTNFLAPPGEALTAWHYRPAALAEAMADAHYPLQAALYSVALHRYLRWRLVDYDPDRHLGGVAYLFLRGMTGAGGPLVDGEPCGVFAWRPPSSFVGDLSDALDRGDP